MWQNSLIAVGTAAITMVSLQACSVQTVPVTYDFSVEVTQGPLAGNKFNGSFSFDKALAKGVGQEEMGVSDGLKVKMKFFEQEYTEKSDQGYPEFPKLILEDGQVKRLDYWVEEGERIVWWGLPGWEIDLSQRK